jgi:predicted transcriptional regulator with HTH domain
MPTDRKDIISLGLVENLKGKYNIRIYAIESYGKESENFIEDTINIS